MKKQLIFILLIFICIFNFAQVNWECLAPMPEGKSQHGFETCNGKLYAIAGHDNKKTFEYNPQKDIWIEKSELPILVKWRQSPVLRCVKNKLYCIGGYDGDGKTFSKDVWQYDPSKDSWKLKSPMPTGREDFGSAILNNKIYCFGGIENFKTPLKVLEIYDPVKDKWDINKKEMPDCKLLGDFGVSFRGKIYAIGASSSMDNYPILNPQNDVFEYNPKTDKWIKKSPIPESTCYKEVEAIRGKLYVISGVKSGNWRDSTIISSKIFEYNIKKDSWMEIQFIPFGSLGSALAVYRNKIYISGGNTNGYKGENSHKLYSIEIK